MVAAGFGVLPSKTTEAEADDKGTRRRFGRRIEVIADLDRVRGYCGGTVVADHARVWAKHQSLTLPEHDQAAKQLRRDRIGVIRPTTEPDVEIRCLDDYDTALAVGVDETVA